MKTIEITGTGKQATLTIGQRDIPAPASSQILIKVAAAGLNRADLLQKIGKYPAPAGASDILGMEVAGEITAIGSDVKGFQVGDRVCALIEGGGYAEYATADYRQTLPIPDNLDYVQAAAIPEAFFTVWSNLFDNANLQKGESLLIHGGTSGVGIAAIQTAKSLGIKCFATAGSDKKCEFLRQDGVTAINYNTQDFVSILQSEKIDVVLDIVGGEYFQKNIDVLAPNGRLICLSFLGGAKAEVNFTPFLIKNLTIMGTTLRNKPVEYKQKIADALHKNIWPLLTNGTITPVVDSIFSLDDAQKAHELMQSGQHIGKIILKV